MPLLLGYSDIKFTKTKTPTKICKKLLWICYYYASCFDLVAFRMKRQNTKEIKNKVKNIRRSIQFHIPKHMLALHIFLRILFCIAIIYGVIYVWTDDDYILSILIYCHVSTVLICPIVMVIVELWNIHDIKRNLNSLVRIAQITQDLNKAYGIFSWTHAGFIILKIITFACEIIINILLFMDMDQWYHCFLMIAQSFIFSQIWLNIHAMTLLYLGIDIIYGALNHYMMNVLLPRLRIVQPHGKIGYTSKQINRLTEDMSSFIELYKKLYRVGMELHRLWQIPLIFTLLSLYIAIICFIYYILWQYIETNVILYGLQPYIFKMIVDIILLSLAAHRAIQGSQLIAKMGLEKAQLVEHTKWHKQMELFLYYFNMNEFKLNIMGLLDITNELALSYFSGILTFISIFVPFAIKNNRLKTVMENQN